jgi:hypothetical protein
MQWPRPMLRHAQSIPCLLLAATVHTDVCDDCIMLASLPVTSSPGSHSAPAPFASPACKLECEEGAYYPPEYPEYAVVRFTSMLQVVFVSNIVKTATGQPEKSPAES